MKGHFFACDFRGTPGNSGVRTWANERDGATFKLTDPGKYVWGVLATDATFAPDGSLFVSDWVTGWDGVGKGRVYRFENAETLAPTSAALLAMDFSHLEAPRLAAMLTHADRRVRLEAQYTLTAKNEVDTLLAVAEDATADRVARRHAVWGYGQCVRRHGADPVPLAALADDEDAVVRWWAVRLLGELAPERFASTITAALRDEDPRVVREAALAATDRPAAAWLRDALMRFPEDPAVFHAATVGLAATQTPAELRAWLSVEIASKPGVKDADLNALNDRLHLAAVVAARRAGPAAVSEVFDYFADGSGGISPRVMAELWRALLDAPPGGTMAADGAALDTIGNRLSGFVWPDDPAEAALQDAMTRREMAANTLRGDAAGIARLLEFAASYAPPADLRREALAYLAEWTAPDRLDRVTGRLRPAAEWAAASPINEIRDGEVVRYDFELKELLTGYAPVLLRDPAGGRSGGNVEPPAPPAVLADALDLLAQYEIAAALPDARRLAEDPATPAKVRVTALNAVDTLADPADSVAVAKRALTAENPAVRAAARAVLVRRDPAGAVASLSEAVATGEAVERQAAVAALAGLRSPEADAVLKTWLDKLLAGDAPAEVTLELLEAADSREDGGLGEYLSMYEDSRGPDKLDAWTESLSGGDPEAGKEIFFGRSAASCRRCHIAEGSGGAVGPALDGIAAKRDRKYLLESIVNPDAKIAEGYATAVVLTDDGRVRTGVLRADTEAAVTLVMPTGEEVVIPAETVLDRAVGTSAMPADIPDALSKREMRDLVAYLATLTEPAEEKGAAGHE